MRYRYLLWHFDGALFKTGAALRQATLAALAGAGTVPSADTQAALLRDIDGAVAGRVAEHYGLPRKAFESEWAEHYRAILLRDQSPFPGAVALCRRLAESGGHNYLYSARPSGDVARFLAAFGMTELFTGWLTADTTDEPSALSFAPLLAACRLPRAGTLVISNRVRDVALGQQAGVATCYVGLDSCPEATLTPRDYTALEKILFAPSEVVS